jgi:hypothetical protein
LLVLSVLFLLLGRRKRPTAAPPDAAWANRELAAADLTSDRCAVVLRQYLSFRFAIPAGYQTTPEVVTALSAEDRMPPDAVADWRALLEECDAARFSGAMATVAGLADRARAIVQRAEASIEAGTRRTDQTEA